MVNFGEKINSKPAEKHKILQNLQKDTVKEFFGKKDAFAKKTFFIAMVIFITAGLVAWFSSSLVPIGIFAFLAFMSTFLI
ncbi:MAG TPA: hypothetical protein P5230_01385 [Candidatus Magasanikbacteria bacterium]|nr:hypothetical protein [Candidatus Magasanikbacteria bacterium]